MWIRSAHKYGVLCLGMVIRMVFKIFVIKTESSTSDTVNYDPRMIVCRKFGSVFPILETMAIFFQSHVLIKYKDTFLNRLSLSL